jgi:small subunit ribosomal protein S24e
MEIEIDSKRNNPLLNRTEIYFTIKHEGEGTPNREIIRSELADKLNVKKENIVVNTVHSSFGNQEITGYAKVYSSLKNIKNLERDYILKRNKIIESKDKDEKKEKKPSVEPPIEPAGAVKEEKPDDGGVPKEEEQPAEKSPKEETPSEDKPSEQPSEPPKTDEKPSEQFEDKSEEKPKNESEKSAEEKKE